MSSLMPYVIVLAVTVYLTKTPCSSLWPRCRVFTSCLGCSMLISGSDSGFFFAIKLGTLRFQRNARNFLGGIPVEFKRSLSGGIKLVGFR